MARYGMVIDLQKCIGCLSCVIACKAENGTPPGVFWCSVKDMEFGKYPQVSRVFLPTLCMHCGDAPCIEVCPTGASYKREDGIVLIDHEKCAGCRYCVEACPYGARYFNQSIKGYFGTGLTPSEEIGYQGHKAGVVEKCTLCAHRVAQGKNPACVQVCIGGARYFGDLDDPTSEVSRLIASKKGYQLRKEMGTDPSVYYLPASKG